MVKSSLVTVIIPVGHYHKDLANRAMESVKSQTIQTDLRATYDLYSKGPAELRNQLASNVDTPFIVFLDADDTLEPNFVEECLKAYQTGKYVYTSWTEGEVTFRANPCPWQPGDHHIITTLYPTAYFKMLGGFDEQLPGHEDADFYMRSYAHKICGILLDKPLVNRPDDSGRRSVEFHARADYKSIIASVVAKNGGLENITGCCDNPGVQVENMTGQQMEGDVLAESLWLGTRSENGSVSGRQYIAGNHSKVWIDPRDVEARPDLWRVIQGFADAAPKREAMLKQAGLL